MKVTLYNPSTARRIIHTGGAESRTIEILPHKSVENIELADPVVERLRSMQARDPENELRVTELAETTATTPAMKMGVKDAGVSVVKAKR